MAREHIRLAIEAERQVQGFASAAAEMRSIPVLTTKAVSIAFERGGQQSAAARRSLKGIYERTSPHLLELPSDEHITGKVGGRAFPKRRLPSTVSGSASNQAKGSALQLLVPTSRAIRPINASGQTSFHLSFEMITKNHVDFGLTTKSGRRARPDEHGKYLEDEEKRAIEPVTVPVDPQNFAHYQEREQALALAEQECVFSNIEGDREDRIALFRAAGESEKSNRPPTLKVDIRIQSPLVSDFLAQAWNDEMLAVAMTKTGFDKVGKWSKELHETHASEKFIEDFCNLTFSGEDALTGYEVLSRLGWREEWQNPLAYRSQGIEWDTGKSGRIQMRLVGEIPHELDRDGRSRFMKSLADRFDALGVPYVLVMHRPTADNHEKNWHFHLIYWDRPAERFDPETVQQRLDAGEAEVVGYSKRNSKYLETALNDPKVQAQAGRFDFEVEYTYTDAKGRERTVYPFKQNKNRECTRTDFVPDLRAFIADISNRELERANASRRVCASTYDEMDIPKEPDGHLNDAANRKELSGQSTSEGSANEKRQWDYVQLMLDRQLELEKNELVPIWQKLGRVFRTAGADEATIEESSGRMVQPETRRSEVARSSPAGGTAFRPPSFAPQCDGKRVLQSPRSGSQRHGKPQGKRKAQLSSEAAASPRRPHSRLKKLFREEFGLELRLEAQADELSKQANSLLEKNGLGRDLLFRVGPVDEPATSRKQASSDNAKLKQPVVPRAAPAKISAPAPTTDLSEQLDIIAKKRVPYTIKEEALASGEIALIAIIPPREQALHGLPKNVVARTSHAVSRLVNIHAARVQSTTAFSAIVAEVQAPGTLTDPPEPGKPQPVSSEAPPHVAPDTPVAADASTDHPPMITEGQSQIGSDASREQRTADPSKGEKLGIAHEVTTEAKPNTTATYEDAPETGSGRDHSPAVAQARDDLEEESRWNAANINSIKTAHARRATQPSPADQPAAASPPAGKDIVGNATRMQNEGAGDSKFGRASPARAVSKALPQGSTSRVGTAKADEMGQVDGANAGQPTMSQSDYDRMETDPIMLVKTGNGNVLPLARHVPPSLAVAAANKNYAAEFNRWYQRQENERHEMAVLLAKSSFTNRMELETAVEAGEADSRLAQLSKRWNDTPVLTDAVDRGLGMRRREEREAALEAERKLERNRQAARTHDTGHGH